MPRIRCAAVAVVVCLLIAGFWAPWGRHQRLTSPRTRAIEFNEWVNTSNDRIRTAGERFGLTVKPVFEEKSANPADVRAALDELTALVDRTRDGLPGHPLPPGPEAEALRDAELAFLDAETAVCRDQYTRIPRLLTDEAVTPAERKERLYDIFRTADGREEEALTRLRLAQLGLVGKYHLER